MSATDPSPHSSAGFDFAGRVVVVTGGTRGIGQAIADAFRDGGASVLLTGTDRDDVEKRNREVKSAGLERVEYLHADFADSSSLNAFLAAIRARPRIDVLVNNAGVNRIAGVEDVGDDDLDWLLGINLRAPYLLSRDVAPLMRQHGYGRIVNVASIWSVITKAGRSMYSTSKSGLVGMTKTFAVELAPHGILVNAVSPGFTLTELTRSTLRQEDMEAIAEQIPTKRFADPAEMAQVVCFLASDLNTYITGQNIVVDGGFTII